MTDWIADQLALDHPGLAVRTGTGDTVPLARSLAASEVLPIIDGLDELPERRRTEVIAEVNAHGSDNPVVMTCRPEEYKAATLTRPVTLASVIPLVPPDLVQGPCTRNPSRNLTRKTPTTTPAFRSRPNYWRHWPGPWPRRSSRHRGPPRNRNGELRRLPDRRAARAAARRLPRDSTAAGHRRDAAVHRDVPRCPQDHPPLPAAVRR